MDCCMGTKSITATGNLDILSSDRLPEEYSNKVASDDTLREINPFIKDKIPRTYKKGTVTISTF